MAQLLDVSTKNSYISPSSSRSQPQNLAIYLSNTKNVPFNEHQNLKPVDQMLSSNSKNFNGNIGEQGLSVANYLREENGAIIVSCTSALPKCPASNLLNGHRNNIWMSEEGMPQNITIDLRQLRDRPRFFKCFGWDCWHDYSTNPAVVEVFFSQDGNSFVSWITLRSELKAGVSLFSIDSVNHRFNFLKILIKETHGGSKAYMNSLYLLEENPDSKASRLHKSENRVGGTPDSCFEGYATQNSPLNNVNSPRPQEMDVSAEQYQYQQIHQQNQNSLQKLNAGDPHYFQILQQQQKQSNPITQQLPLHSQHEFIQDAQHYSHHQYQYPTSSQQQNYLINSFPQGQHFQNHLPNPAIIQQKLQGRSHALSGSSYPQESEIQAINGNIFYSPQQTHPQFSNSRKNLISDQLNNQQNAQSHDPTLTFTEQKSAYNMFQKESLVDAKQSGFSSFEGGAPAPAGLNELVPAFNGRASGQSSRNLFQGSPNDDIDHKQGFPGEFTKQLFNQGRQQQQGQAMEQQSKNSGFIINNNSNNNSYQSNSNLQQQYQDQQKVMQQQNLVEEDIFEQQQEQQQQEYERQQHIQSQQNAIVGEQMNGSQQEISNKNRSMQSKSNKSSTIQSNIHNINNNNSGNRHQSQYPKGYQDQLFGDESMEVQNLKIQVVSLKKEVKHLQEQLITSAESMQTLGSIVEKLQESKNVLIDKVSLLSESLSLLKQEMYERFAAQESDNNQNNNNNEQILEQDLLDSSPQRHVDELRSENNNIQQRANTLEKYLPPFQQPQQVLQQQQLLQQQQQQPKQPASQNDEQSNSNNSSVRNQNIQQMVSSLIDKRLSELESTLSKTVFQALHQIQSKVKENNSSQDSQLSEDVTNKNNQRETKQFQQKGERKEKGNDEKKNSKVVQLLDALQAKLILRQTKVEQLNSQEEVHKKIQKHKKQIKSVHSDIPNKKSQRQLLPDSP